ncbi:protein kinase domain-containing protein [Archangium lansingense]|uniref:Protein kinase n=1 Tax=Archangium lansingense TaxID=2995310 RepID=A0ABT4APL6_9BACT|nr:protein kinase [Archangium lansinium]MCY1083641.1 protein kinase [Archangium lansinium]
MAGSKLPFAPGDVRGRQMGNYEVLCRLSTGGMAEIFLATKRGLAGFHKPVVLKKILPDIHDQEEFVQMFLDEAKVTAAFNHPHIAQVFDLDVDDDELFLAMEFVPGATLIEVARACRAVNEPMPVGFGLAAVRDTALALHYAHTFTDALGQSSPVIHRDVAEKNIMVTYEGVTKLLDFGIAKSLTGASRTAAGMVKGTSGYMSPEQILGQPLDTRSDLFSLGVVLHECLTGMRLFPGKAPMAVVNAVLKGPIPEPSRTNKAIPPELDAIVLKALARKREDRYATTLEFARELERAVGPLIWLPEKSGELLRRLFAERREQTRQLLASGRAAVDSTGVVKLAQLFSDKEASGTPPPPPPAPPSPPGVAAPGNPTPTPARSTTAPRLPTISAPHLPAPGPARPEETELVSYPVVAKPPVSSPVGKRTSSASQLPATPPPPPEETGVLPPSAQATSRVRPPRASVDPSTLPSLPVLVEPPRAPVAGPARASVDPSTLPSLPVLVEPPRPVRAPTPPEQGRTATPEQTRAGSPARARSLSRSEAVPAVQETKEPGLKTAIIRPPRTPSTSEQPVTSDETVPRYDATRAARRPSLSHLDAVTQPTGSTSPLLPGPPAPAAPSARALSPEGPTVPVMRAPLARPVPTEPEDEDGPEFLTAPYLVPPSASSSPPVEPEDEDGPEFLTAPYLASPAAPARPLPAQPRSQEPDEEDLTPAHPQPVSRRHVPVKPKDDEGEELTASSTPSPAPSRRGVLWAALLLLLLVGGLATLVVLRLDGGLLSSRLFPPPPPPEATRATEPRTEGSTPAPQAAQAPSGETAGAPTPAATPEAAAPEAASASATPEATAPNTGLTPSPTEVATAAGAGSPEAKTEALPTGGEPTEASQDEEPQDEAPQAKASESAQPAKRGKVAPSRRTQRTPTASSVESSPEQVTTADEADRAWQALERERAGAAEPSGEKGSLTLVTEPYAKVYLGSRLVGETPLFRMSFAPGKHTLRLVAPNTKPLKLQVEIKAGEVTSIRTALDKLARE